MSRGKPRKHVTMDATREAIALGGAVELTDEQLVAAVIREGTGARRALDLSADLLREKGGLSELADASWIDLLRFGGVGPARAAALLAAFELGRRALARPANGERLSSSAQVHGTFWPMLACERVEVFCCAMVDAKLRLMRAQVISKGTLTASIVHPRDAYRPAVRAAASGVIFAHNHPSGDPLPSDEDMRITGRLEEVGGILGIPLLDHVVIGSDGSYYSFADAGVLEPQTSGYRGMVLR